MCIPLITFGLEVWPLWSFCYFFVLFCWAAGILRYARYFKVAQKFVLCCYDHHNKAWVEHSGLSAAESVIKVLTVGDPRRRRCRGGTGRRLGLRLRSRRLLCARETFVGLIRGWCYFFVLPYVFITNHFLILTTVYSNIGHLRDQVFKLYSSFGKNSKLKLFWKS